MVGSDFLYGDGAVAGIVGEAPYDNGAFVEWSAGAAGGEVATELGGVVDGVEDLGDGFLDFGLNLEFELHGLVHLVV